MGLAVIVHFIVVRIAGFFSACRVVGAGSWVIDQVGGHSIPGLIGDFVTRKYIQAQELLLASPGCGYKVGIEIRTRPVDVAIGTNFGQTPINTEATFKQSRSKLHIAAQGIKGTNSAIHFSIRILIRLGRIEVDAGSKSCRSIGRGTHATLDLHVIGRTGKIGHVDPKHTL